MNWFQRYGIPGAYFCVLTLAWIAACYPCKCKENIKDLVVLAVIAILPIGYILTIFQMLIYLSIPCLGIHRATQKEANLDPPENKTKIKWKHEAIFEAYTHIHSFNYAKLEKKEDKKFEEVKFIQEWIRKRMDILTINFTLFIATVISFLIIVVFGKCFFSKCEPQCKNLFGIIILSFIVMAICIKTYCMVKKSIKIVLVDYYNTIKSSKNLPNGEEGKKNTIKQ